jgi:hypothetical protein
VSRARLGSNVVLVALGLTVCATSVACSAILGIELLPEGAAEDAGIDQDAGIAEDAGIDQDAGADTAAPPAPVCVPTDSADDSPDPEGIDANCDGVDGVASDSVFVDTLGSDANDGAKASPVMTVGRGLALAKEQGKHHVLVAAGTYSQPIELVSGISIHGGYDRGTWKRAPLDRSAKTVLTAASSPVVAGDHVDRPTRMTGLVILAPSAGQAGKSSIAVRLVESSAVRFEDSVLRGGAGGPGRPGAE